MTTRPEHVVREACSRIHWTFAAAAGDLPRDPCGPSLLGRCRGTADGAKKTDDGEGGKAGSRR